MKILQISDIHWRGITRHDEYTRSFNQLFDEIRRIKPDVVLGTGDFFHTKTQGISPEVIDKMVWMFKTLGDMVPTHLILGNHDGNLANDDRQDVISPLLKALDHPNIFLYKKSGVYPVVGYKDGDTVVEGLTTFSPKANFCVFSCFDKDGWDEVKPEAGDDVVNIALYHGSISGCKTDSEWSMREGEEDVSIFDGYDYAMLGDIHKFQSMATRKDFEGTWKPWVAYPGSMIQQNFGEDETKGFLVWDIRGKNDWDLEFVALENKQPFVTVPWMGSTDSTINFIKDSRGDRAFVPGTRFRVSSSYSISPFESRQLQETLKTQHQAAELSFKFETIAKSETIQTDSVSVRKTSLRNDVPALLGLYKEFLSTTASKYSLSTNQIKEAEDIIAAYLAKFNASEAESPRDVIWSIKNMEFDNLFRYGEGNAINFSKLDGIIGVFGPNRTGKSSIVGSMMYGLFNTTDRGPLKNGNIVNYNKKHGCAKINVTVAGTDYVIERESVRTEPPAAKRKGYKAPAEAFFDPDKTTTSLNLYKIQADGTRLELNSVTRDDTDKEIRRLIGKPEDFLLTAFSSQGGINRFIEEGATQRKAILNRFLDLDIFDRLFGFAKDDYTSFNNKMAKFTSGSWEQAIILVEKLLLDKQDLLRAIEENISSKRHNLDELRLWMLQNKEAGNAAVDPKELAEVQAMIASTNLRLETYKAQKIKLVDEIKVDQDSIAAFEKILSNVNVEELHLKSKEMSEVALKVREIATEHKAQETVLQSQEKSVKKLATVPCGDQFPECRFIKDSHDDKRVIEQQRITVRELMSSLETITENLKEYQEEKLDVQIADHDRLVTKIKICSSGLESKQSKLETAQHLLEQRETELISLQEQEKTLLQRMGQIDSTDMDNKKVELKLTTMELQKLEGQRNGILIDIGVETGKLAQLKKDQVESAFLLNKIKIYETIQAAFNKNGIPAIILKTQLPAINMELAKLLSNVVDFKITLETDTNSNVMDVFLEDAISRRIIELASGMEKMIASLALRVALVNLSSLPKPDIFIIDEGFGVLDEEGIQKCMQLLSIMKTYFKTILVVSHVSAIKEVADHIVEITNLGLESKISV